MAEQHCFRAEIGEARLGITFRGIPPQVVIVSAIAEGSWASRVGVEVGDELVTVNGEVVSELTSDGFQRALAERPVSLCFREQDDFSEVSSSISPRSPRMRRSSTASSTSIGEPQTREVLATVQDRRLGVQFQGAPPGVVEVVNVEAGTWAATAGIEVGSILTAAASGKEASSWVQITDMDVPRFKALMQQRPLRLRLQMPQVAFRQVSAPVGQERLGVVFHGVPPGCLKVLDVVPDSWAAQVGLHPGNLILAINDEDLHEMPKERFQELMKHRPLSFTVELGMSEDGDEDSHDGDEAEIDNYQDFVVDIGEGGLGMLFDKSPPGRVLISGVMDGGWAASVDIEPGDVLVSLNDEELIDMSAERFEQALQERPLKLRLIFCNADSCSQEEDGAIVAGEDVIELGMVFEFCSGGEVAVKEVMPDSWAERVGIDPGDLIETLNGQSLKDMPEESIMELLGERPLAISIRRVSYEEPSALVRTFHDIVVASGLAGYLHQLVEPTPTGGAHELVVDNSVAVGSAGDGPAALGLDLDGVPPGCLRVLAIRADSWAASKDIKVGDIITELNGEALDAMTREHFIQLLEERPLKVGLDSGMDDPLSPCDFDALLESECNIRLLALDENTDQDLGLIVATLASSPCLCVVSVEDSSWAAEVGICVGDYLSIPDGHGAAESLTDEGAAELLRRRPLRMKHIPADVISEAEEAGQLEDDEISLLATIKDGQLGLTFNNLPPGHLEVGVRDDTWAARVGVQAGDLLVAVNGENLMDMSQKVFMDSLLQRPIVLRLLLMQRQPMPVQPSLEEIGPPKPRLKLDKAPIVQFSEDLDLDAIVVADITSLGFRLSSWPPHPALIGHVEPGSWAYDMGLQAGDIIYAVNGRQLDDFSSESFIAEMRRRPLRLAMVQQASLVDSDGGSTPSSKDTDLEEECQSPSPSDACDVVICEDPVGERCTLCDKALQVLTESSARSPPIAEEEDACIDERIIEVGEAPQNSSEPADKVERRPRKERSKADRRRREQGADVERHADADNPQEAANQSMM